jgi:hypothetical protein
MTSAAAARAAGIDANTMRGIVSGIHADSTSIEELQRVLEALRAASR